MSHSNYKNAKVVSSTNETEVSIPSRKNKIAIISVIVFLGVWIYLFKIVILPGTGIENGSINEIDGFSMYFLIAWTLSTLFLIFLLLWGFFGKETFSIKESQILLSKKLFGIRINKKLKKAKVTNLRFNKVNTNIDLLKRNNWAVWGLGEGKIKFDFGKKSYSFGLGLDDNEAIQLVNFLQEKIN